MQTLNRAIKEINQDFDQLLFTRVAVKLAGKPVIVRFENELDDEIYGYTIKEAGNLVVNIDPDLDPEQQWKTYLHEVAHCKLHADSIADNQAPPVKVNPAAVPIVRGLRFAASKRREYEAINLSTYWRVKAGSGTIRERLMNLLG